MVFFVFNLLGSWVKLLMSCSSESNMRLCWLRTVCMGCLRSSGISLIIYLWRNILELFHFEKISYKVERIISRLGLASSSCFFLKSSYFYLITFWFSFLWSFGLMPCNWSYPLWKLINRKSTCSHWQDLRNLQLQFFHVFLFESF